MGLGGVSVGGCGVSVGIGAGVSVGTGTGVSVGRGRSGCGVLVGTGIGVDVGLTVGTQVGVGVHVGVGVFVGVAVLAGVSVTVGLGVGLAVGVVVGEGEAVGVEVGVAVTVGAPPSLTLLTTSQVTATRAIRPMTAPTRRGRLLALGSSGSETVPDGWVAPNSARRISVTVWKRLAGCRDIAFEIARSVSSLRSGRCCRAGTRSLVTMRSATVGGGVPVSA